MVVGQRITQERAPVTQRDGPGHVYAEVDNIRITYVPAKDRDPDKDWAGSDVIRVQAYRGDTSRALFPGAELPIRSPEVFVELISALCSVYNTGRQGS
jgi:hypothetical protein